jgi:uncharacterized protein YcbK (DUF882 family)
MSNKDNDQAVTQEYLDNALEALDGAISVKLEKRLEKIEAGLEETQKQIKHTLNHLHNIEKQAGVFQKEHQILADRLSDLRQLTENTKHSDSHSKE